MRSLIGVRSTIAVTRRVVVVLLVLAALLATRQPGVSAAPVGPAGISATDWQAIQELLPPTQQAYMKASNIGSGDTFGSSMALAGDTLVVGAQREDSAATGVNGDQTDNRAGFAGAAYVLVAHPTLTPTVTATTTAIPTPVAPTGTPSARRPAVYLPMLHSNERGGV